MFFIESITCRSREPGNPVPTLIDEELDSKRQAARLNTIKQYREWRKQVNLRREFEATQRNENKLKQLEQAEDWQVSQLV